MPLDRTIHHLTALYHSKADPWEHLSSPYERQKYASTLDALGGRRFRQGLEVGCGIGALSELLAPRCDRLTSIDFVGSALARARIRLQAAKHVVFVQGTAPGDLPALVPDLIVLSEVLYFMTAAEIGRLAAWIASHATPDALTVAVSWTGETGEALSGHQSVACFARALPHQEHRRSKHDGYRIDTFTGFRR